MADPLKRKKLHCRVKLQIEDEKIKTFKRRYIQIQRTACVDNREHHISINHTNRYDKDKTAEFSLDRLFDNKIAKENIQKIGHDGIIRRRAFQSVEELSSRESLH